MIIERATGRPLGRELAQRIFEPLGLRSTTFPLHAATLGGPHARGYSLDRDARLAPIPGPLRDFTRLNPSPAWASGNIVSTMHDVARFYRALLGGRLLPAALLTEMKTTVATDSPDTRYGLGLFEFASPCGPLYGNDGDIAGYSTRAMASVDGTRQIELTINASAAPAAVEAPLRSAIDAAVRLGFAGAPCARAEPGRGGARHDRGS
jgi:D-alanyl-D-alanine carboxypeptidase